MKKWLALAVIAVLAVFAVATVVSAQAPQPQQTPQPGFGRGMMRQGQGMMAQVGGEEGPMHDGMVAAFAEKLGLKVAELEARLDKGESMWQIASSTGMTAEQFNTFMLEAHNAGIDAALKAGTLTQEQADWMKQRGQGQGMGAGRGGMDPDDCPMNNGTSTTTGQRGGMMGRGGGMMGQQGRWTK